MEAQNYFNGVMSSPVIRIKIVTLVHFVLLSNALFSYNFPSGYLFYNLLFMGSLFWTMHCKDSIDAAHTAAMINFSAIFLDFACIIAFFSSHYIWAMIFAIVNLVARPFSLLILHRELVDRGGSMSTQTVFPAPTQQRSYQDIDRPHQSVPTHTVTPTQPPNQHSTGIF